MPTPPEQSVFDQRVDRYDALIDWPKRLANETPFYRRIFEEAGVRRVLDAACGTGRHAKMFHDWGLEVEGSDASPAMITWCRDHYSQPAGLRWVERSYTQPADPPGRFDAVICVGNSLALADDSQSVGPAIAAMLASLRPGGACIVQVLNLWRLRDGLTQWQKCVRVRLPVRAGLCDPGSTQTENDHILLKSIRRVGTRAFLELLDVELLPDGVVRHEVETDTFIGQQADDLAAAARHVGGQEITFFGNHQQEPYSPATSPDLILACRAQRPGQ